MYLHVPVNGFRLLANKLIACKFISSRVTLNVLCSSGAWYPCMLPWAPCIQQGQITVTYNLFLNHSLGEDGKKCLFTSLRKQPTFGNATSGFPAKWCLSNECRNSILMMCHYPDLGSASDWWNQISHASWPIRSTTQIWVVMCHQYGLSALVTQTSFGGKPVVALPNVGCFLRLPIYNM